MNCWASLILLCTSELSSETSVWNRNTLNIKWFFLDRCRNHWCNSFSGSLSSGCGRSCSCGTCALSPRRVLRKWRQWIPSLIFFSVLNVNFSCTQYWWSNCVYFFENGLFLTHTQAQLEVMWAMKAYNHAEVYFNVSDLRYFKLRMCLSCLNTTWCLLLGVLEKENEKYSNKDM